MKVSCSGRWQTFSESLIGQWPRAVTNHRGVWARISDQRSEWASGGHSGLQRLKMGTNGIISTHDLPRETYYVVADFPTDFTAIAPFQADIHLSHSSGRILYGGHLLGCAESGCLLPVHRLPPYPLLPGHLGASGRLGGGQAWGHMVWRGEHFPGRSGIR
eukprot:XP_017445374.1 PREDICTED: uncharacterized protein LOC108349516 [Rattus norvegicus]